MNEVALPLAGVAAIFIGALLVVYVMARKDGYVEAHNDLYESSRAVNDAVGRKIGRLAEAVLDFQEEAAGWRQETERAVDHGQHKYDEEIIFAETERNKIIAEFAKEELALREKLELAGVQVIGHPRSAKYEKRDVPERRPLGASIGGPSESTDSRAGSLTGKGLAELFVEESDEPGGDKSDGG